MKAVFFTLAFLCLFALAPTHAARTPAAQFIVLEYGFNTY